MIESWSKDTEGKYKRIHVRKGEKPIFCPNVIDLRKRICRKCMAINFKCINSEQKDLLPNRIII